MWPMVRPRNGSSLLVPYLTAPSLELMPYWVTMARATADAFSMSLPAPVVGSWKTSSSAARPPSAYARVSIISPRVWVYLSSVGSTSVWPSDRPRGRIVTLCTGASCGIAHATRAWPASWYAVIFFSLSLIARVRRSGPAMTRSIDSSRKSLVIARLSLRAVSSADSLITLARSAPEKPGVRRATESRSTSGENGLPLACTRRIALRPSMSGASTAICRSNRPGRSSAGSRMSGRLVAAIRITPPLVSKPSISTSSWLRVCSRSSWPPPRPAPRWRPTASISSTKTMAGAFALACSKRSRTRLAPTPTNISTKSEPEIE